MVNRQATHPEAPHARNVPRSVRIAGRSTFRDSELELHTCSASVLNTPATQHGCGFLAETVPETEPLACAGRSGREEFGHKLSLSSKADDRRRDLGRDRLVRSALNAAP